MANQGKDEISVTVTSVDGNMTAAFPRSATVGDVHHTAYDKLVRDKTAVPFSATTMEFENKPVADSEHLSKLVKGGPPPTDLRLALTWVSQGG